MSTPQEGREVVFIDLAKSDRRERFAKVADHPELLGRPVRPGATTVRKAAVAGSRQATDAEINAAVSKAVSSIAARIAKAERQLEPQRIAKAAEDQARLQKLAAAVIEMQELVDALAKQSGVEPVGKRRSLWKGVL